MLQLNPTSKNFFSTQRNIRRRDTKAFWLAYLKISLIDKNWTEVVRVKGVLVEMMQEDAYGYVVRSRCQNNATEEIASIFHANKEIKNAAKNNIKSLKIENTVIEDKDTVEEEITTFFNALFNGHHDTGLKDTGEPFKADNSHLDFFLKDLSTLALPDHEKDNLSKDMEIEELEEIV